MRTAIKNHIPAYSLRKAIFVIVAGLIVIFCSYFIVINPLELLIYVLIGMLAFITGKKMHVGLFIIILLPVIGELTRVPFLPGKNILISDLAIGIFIVIWLIKKFSNTEIIGKTANKNPLLYPLVFFGIVGIFSLLQSLLFLHPSEVINGSFYLIRFIEYTLLAIITAEIVKTKREWNQLLTTLIFSAFLIAIGGFIQLIIYPDLGKLMEFGWDPHRDRLVSTWLDPNFIGGLFAFIISILTGIAIHARNFKNKLCLGLLILLFAAALFLTYSRSGYLAFAISIFIIGLFKSRKLLIATMVIFIIGLSLLPRAQERTEDLIRSAQSFIFNTTENPDPTARLRIKSWQQTLELIGKRPLFGVGYNTLGAVKFNEGFVENTEVHSASGSDASILTILATTGIMGLIPFLWLYICILTTAFKLWRDKKASQAHRGYALGIFAGIVGLIGHSFFVNSLLFPQIMIFVWIFTGLMLVPVKEPV